MSSDKLCDRREGLLLLSANPKFSVGVKFPVVANRVVSDSIRQDLSSEERKGVALDVVEQATMPDPFEWTLGVQPGCPKETMDPEIKLFGQTIGVASSRADAGADAGVLKPTSASPPWNTAPSSKQDGGDSSLLRNENEGGVVEKLRTARSSSREECLQPPKSTELVQGSRSTMVFSLGASDSEGAHSDELKDQGEGDPSQYLGDDKHLQKPDKVVSCPRCDSLDTKFCYYNNYNINQPRHFCKNCQRYWTAGGTLRNVPVGAGRRKNKHGVVQRDCTEASVNCPIQSDSGDSASQLLPCALGSPTSQKPASSFKHSQPKRLAGQGSPMRSPRSTISFGQDSGITMPPSFSLHQNGRIPFQSYSTSQGYLTPGPEVYTVGSSDSSSVPVGQRIARFPSGNGIDKDCNRSSLSGQLQDAYSLRSMPSVYNPPLQLESSSGMHRSVLPSGNSGWAGNGASAGLHSGEWPHNYHLELDGKHSTQVVRATYNTATTLPASSSWSPGTAQWGATQWGAGVSHLSNPTQMPTQVWSIGQPMAHNAPTMEHSDVAVSTTLGKRGLSDEGGSMWPSKVPRPHDSKSLHSWSMFGKNQCEVNSNGNSLNLFRPKLELAVACETKDSFVSRHFTTVAAARPVPFQVTI